MRPQAAGGVLGRVASPAAPGAWRPRPGGHRVVGPRRAALRRPGGAERAIATVDQRSWSVCANPAAPQGVTEPRGARCAWCSACARRRWTAVSRGWQFLDPQRFKNGKVDCLGARKEAKAHVETEARGRVDGQATTRRTMVWEAAGSPTREPCLARFRQKTTRNAMPKIKTQMGKGAGHCGTPGDPVCHRAGLHRVRNRGYLSPSLRGPCP